MPSVTNKPVIYSTGMNLSHVLLVADKQKVEADYHASTFFVVLFIRVSE